MSSTTSAKKSVLITGCSAGGIGASLCFTFQKHGWLVFATARNTAKIPKDLTSLPNVEVVQLDVVDPKSISSAVGAVQKLLAEKNNGSGLDMVINNSGVGLPGPMLHADIDKTKAMFDTNFFGVVRVTQAFMGLLIQAKGTLVNISSIAGEVVGPYESMYAATKSALTIASESWRLELEPLGVRVVTLMTGQVDSQFHQNATKEADPTHTLSYMPADGSSPYEPIREYLMFKEQGGYNQKGSMPADEFCDKVYADVVTRGKSGQVWRGGMAWMVWFATGFLPGWVVESIFRGDPRTGMIAWKEAKKKQ